MLEHAYANQGVEGLPAIYLAIILDLDPAAICQASLGDAFIGQLCLGFAQGDAGSVDAVVGGTACMTRPPQPQPTSRRRWLGESRNFRQI